MHTVLIVEDEKLIRQGIKIMIQRSGVPIDNIIECNNGASALEMLKIQQVDVMFTDIRMPKMDGIELVNKMQSLPHKPFTVVISGYDDFSYAVEMLSNGVKEYLLKPIDRDKIKEIMIKLEEEITSMHEAKKQDQSIGVQQLKYLMTESNIDQSEEELILQQYSDNFFKEPYVVCCTKQTDCPSNEKEPFIYLNKINEQDIYICPMSYYSVLQKDQILNLVTGISKEHKGLSELRIAYQEAMKARKRAFYICKSVVYEDKLSDETSLMEIKDNMMAQIAQMLGTSKYEEGLLLLERMLNTAKLGSYAASKLEVALQTLIQSLCDTYQNVLHLEISELEPYEKIYGYEDLQHYWTDLKTWLLQFSDSLNNEYDDYKNKQKIAQAIQFIKDNYNKDLNMAVVSNHISMNYSLFSYAFKQYTGNNFVNYLKEIRMNEAKRLLEETEDKINEISQSVGYENDKHFMKIFKSVYGVSPTEYRKNMTKGKG